MRILTRAASAVTATAVVACCLPAVAHAAQPAGQGSDAAAAQVAERSMAAVPGVETVGPIPVRTATGRKTAELPPSVAVLPSGRVTNPLNPYLSAPAVKELPTTRVRLYDLTAGADITADQGFLWQGELTKGWGPTTAALREGRNYAVTGLDTSAGAWKLLGTFTVSASGNLSGPVAQAGGVHVSLPTGEPQWQWRSPTLPGPTTEVGVALAWTPRTNTRAGVPTGWRLEPVGASPWATLTTYTGASARSASAADTDEATACDSLTRATAPGLVVLRGWNGSSMTFARNTTGVYEQQAGGLRVPGYGNLLTPCEGKDARGNPTIVSWRFIDSDGVTTLFRGGKAVAVYAHDALQATLRWDKDLLVEVGSATGRTIGLDYAGTGTCPASGWTGFDAPATGMLCQVRYPDGSATSLGYQLVAGRSQISLIKDPGNQGNTLGWDTFGRLAATRSPLANLAATRDPAAANAITTISYSASSGRVDRLVGSPSSVGGPTVTQTLTMGAVTEALLQSRADVEAKNTTTSTGLAGSTTYALDPVTFDQRSMKDAAGLTTKRTIDPQTGRITGTVDSLGRHTTVTTDSTGALKSQAGPYVPETRAPEKKGVEEEVAYDATYAAGQTTALQGFRADIFDRPGFLGQVTETAFWARARDASGMNQTWNRPKAFSARLTALWKPTAAEDAKASGDGTPTGDDTSTGWTFTATIGDGTRMALIVGAFECRAEQLQSPEGCQVTDLPRGPKQVTVELRSATPRGYFEVKAAPTGSTPVPVPADQVVPGFQRVTKMTSNDAYPGSAKDPSTELAYADPSRDAPTRITQPGGLASQLTYEGVNPAQGQFGRPLTYTTPGGLTRTSDYWPLNGAVTAPALCGDVKAAASAQLKTRTLQNGTSVTSYYDVMGRVVAQVTTGSGGVAETRCMTYSAAGALRVSSSYDATGALVERTTTEDAVDGNPLVSKVTVEHGPAAPVRPSTTVTSSTTVNLHGMPVVYVDEAGTTTRTTYTPIDDVDTVTLTPAGATQPALTTTSTYRSTDAALDRITVNGKLAAAVTYLPQTGRIRDITYANGFAASAFTYTNTGRPSIVLSSADGGKARMRQEVTYTQFGRATVAKTAVTIPGSPTLSDDRSYTYDAARRLTRATIALDSGTGVQQRTMGYTFGATQDSSCGSAYPKASADALRTGGTRAGVAYTTCYDGFGRVASTTDPQVTGDPTGKEKAAFEYDAFGRVTTIKGGSQPARMSWIGDTTLATLVDGIDASGVSTTMSTYAGRIVDKSVTGPAGKTEVRYGYASGADSSPTVIYAASGGVTGAPTTYQITLPGAVNVTIPADGLATMTFSGLDGSALGTVAAAYFSLSGATSTEPAVTVGPAPRFGPYGETLVAAQPASAQSASALPDYSWQAAGRLETLGGRSSITLAGARPYLPGTGMFLAPDPRFDAGDNLYSYTPGDPINGSDGTGEANGWSWFFEIIGAALVVASFVVGIATGGFLIPVAMSMAAAGLSMISMKMQTEPSPAMDTFRTIMFWGQMAATVVTLGASIAAATKWGARNATIRFLAGKGSAVADDAASAATGSVRSSVAVAGSSFAESAAEQAVKPGAWSRFTSWVKMASPFNPVWQEMGGTRGYLKALGKLSGKWSAVGGAYWFNSWATAWVPQAWKDQMEQQASPA